MVRYSNLITVIYGSFILSLKVFGFAYFQILDDLIVDVIRRKTDLRVLNYYGEEFRI